MLYVKYSNKGPMSFITKILSWYISLDHNLYQMTPKVTTLTLFKNGPETLRLGKKTSLLDMSKKT